MPTPRNRQDHGFLAFDDLSDCIGHVATELSRTPTAGQLASATRAQGLVASSGAINTTETILVKTPLIPGSGGTLQVGSVIKATLLGTVTSTNADVSTFGIRAGILGTTADQLVASAAVTSSGSGTGVAFEADIEFVVRTLGAAGTGEMGLRVSNTGVTGLVAVTNTVVLAAGTNLATTTATFLEVTYVSAAVTTTATFQIADLLVIT